MEGDEGKEEGSMNPSLSSSLSAFSPSLSRSSHLALSVTRIVMNVVAWSRAYVESARVKLTPPKKKNKKKV